MAADLLQYFGGDAAKGETPSMIQGDFGSMSPASLAPGATTEGASGGQPIPTEGPAPTPTFTQAAPAAQPTPTPTPTLKPKANLLQYFPESQQQAQPQQV